LDGQWTMTADGQMTEIIPTYNCNGALHASWKQMYEWGLISSASGICTCLSDSQPASLHIPFQINWPRGFGENVVRIWTNIFRRMYMYTWTYAWHIVLGPYRTHWEIKCKMSMLLNLLWSLGLEVYILFYAVVLGSYLAA
jgi:hypothetical protein